jgi:pyruvate-formate lyase
MNDCRPVTVRITGFRCYFVELHKGLRDHVIRRTELDLV